MSNIGRHPAGGVGTCTASARVNRAGSGARFRRHRVLGQSIHLHTLCDVGMLFLFRKPNFLFLHKTSMSLPYNFGVFLFEDGNVGTSNST